MESHIIIRGASEADVKRMLNDWLMSYVDRLPSQITFELAPLRENAGGFVLKLDKSIDDTLFFYMVDYFSEPRGFDRTFAAEGYTTSTKHKKLLGKNIFVFVDSCDEGHDGVIIGTDFGEMYRSNFEGKLAKKRTESRYKPLPIDTAPAEVITFDAEMLKVEAMHRREERAQRNINIRFKIVAVVLFTAIPLSYWLAHLGHFFDDISAFIYSTFALVMWFLADYRIFDDRRRAFVCVLLALGSVVLAALRLPLLGFIFETMPLSAVIVAMATARFFPNVREERAGDLVYNRITICLQVSACLILSIAALNPILRLLFM